MFAEIMTPHKTERIQVEIGPFERAAISKIGSHYKQAMF